MSDDQDLAACAALLQRGDPDRFRAAMAAPLDMRRLLLPLYAFNLEVARAPWVTKEPLIAEMRLQWWRDALDEIAEGGRIRRHEVVTPLAAALDVHAAKDLDALVEARRADIEGAAPEGREALLSYIDATAGILLWTAARLAGASDEAGWRDAGRAQGVASFLSAVPELVAKGRHALPHGDPVEEMRALAEAGQAAFAKARAARLGGGPARPVLAALAGTGATLAAVLRDPAAAFAARPERPAWRQAAETAWIVASGRL
jgi:phytoene/squalene synthetase